MKDHVLIHKVLLFSIRLSDILVSLSAFYPREFLCRLMIEELEGLESKL